jgi:predicted transcriptional regulator
MWGKEMRGRRSKDRIILEILHTCSEGANVTRIVYKVNTNFTIVRFYLNSLITKGLVEPIEGNPKLYKTTPRGLALMNKLSSLYNELED